MKSETTKKISPFRRMARSATRRTAQSFLDDVAPPPGLVTAPPGEPEPVPHSIVWGAISRRRALSSGALAPVDSVLLLPDVPPLEAARVLALFPDELFPVQDDTAESLAARLGRSAFLDDINVPAGGTSSGWVRLNATTQPQPRLIRWSAPVQPTTGGAPAPDEDAEPTVRLYNYPRHNKPSVSDLCCRQWPEAVAEMASYVHKLAYPYLGAVSKVTPPNYSEQH